MTALADPSRAAVIAPEFPVDRPRTAVATIDVGKPGRAAAEVPAGPRSGGRAPAVVVAGLSFVLSTVFAVRRHQLFQTGAYDLGIFGQGVRGYAHLHLPDSQIRAPLASSGGAGYPLLGDHFSPVLALLGPVYRLIPHVEVLLVAQAALVAWSVYLVTRVAGRRLGGGRHGRWAGPAIGGAYALSWGLQRLVGFDFHEVCFALPLVCLAMEAYLARRWAVCAAWAGTLLLVKEDMGFTVFAFGLLLFSRRSRRLGTLLCVAGPAIAALSILVVIPHFNPGHVYGYLGGEATDGTGARGFLSDPLKLPILLLWPPEKLATLILVLLPTGLLAARSPLIVLAVPDLVLRFIADNTFYWGTKFQYSAVLMPIVFFALIDALERRGNSARRARSRTTTPAVVALIAVALAPFFGLGETTTAEFWNDSPHVEAANHAISLIPSGSRVAVPDELAPHLIDRDTVYLDWNGLFGSDAPRFDWIIANVTPQACWRDDPRVVEEALAAGYVEVSDVGGYVVLRLPPTRI